MIHKVSHVATLLEKIVQKQNFCSVTNTVVLIENERLSFPHKKVVSEQKVLPFYEKFIWDYICRHGTILFI